MKNEELTKLNNEIIEEEIFLEMMKDNGFKYDTINEKKKYIKMLKDKRKKYKK